MGIKKRAVYGAGSMYERAPGVFRLRVSAGTDALTGKPIVVQETFHGGSKAAAKRLSALTTEHSLRTAEATGRTLGDLLDAWLETAEHASLTTANYRRAVRVLPKRLADLPAAKVNGSDLARLYRRLVDTGTSPHRVRYLHAAIGAAYTAGVSWGWVGVNPARTVHAPSVARRSTTMPAEKQLADILAAARTYPTAEHPNAAVWLWLRLAVETGARRGEILGLQWGDIDVDAGLVCIRRSIEASTIEAKSTKTGHERVVDIGPDLRAELKTWRTACRERAFAAGRPLPPTAYVLSDDLGTSPWRPDYASRVFAKLRKRADVPAGVRLHDVRHANATALISAGVDIAVVSGRLGHSQTSTTLNIYTHAVRARAQVAAEHMGRYATGE